MTTRTMMGFGLATLLAGTAMVGTAVTSAVAGAVAGGSEARAAARSASSATRALARHKAGGAVRHAEAAVALAPVDASYRALLGRAYLAAGRFASAASAYKDSLTLDPGNGGAALNLALAQIATGGWDDARATLSRYEGQIDARDYGLAVALAGDPARGVEVLTAAARTPGADARTRQNLALAYALAGRWQEAKVVVAADIAPDQVDQRIMQWASFSRPSGAADQVAALLGVTPAVDPGLPVQLALSGTAPAVARVDPVENYMPGVVDEAAAAAAAPVPDVAAVEPAPPAAVASISNISFAPRGEIVQAIAAAAVTPAATVAPARLTPAPRKATVTQVRPAPARGGYYVQLGAFENAGVAKDAWARVARRHHVLAGQVPVGARATVNGASYYRLSVGGFAEGDARAICRQLRASGGRCFVRTGMGDAVAQWVRGPQFAAR